MIKKIGEVLGVVGVLYAGLTYGSWYLASNYSWDQGGEHGCMNISLSGVNVSADILSGKRKLDGILHTTIRGAFPVFNSAQSGEFNIVKRTQQGTAKLTLFPNEIRLGLIYGGSSPFREPEGEIIFKRVKACVDTGEVYDH